MFVEHKSPGELPSIRESESPQLDGPSRLLLKAADLIDAQGWVQGSWANENGYCLYGALNRSAADYDETRPAKQRLAAFLGMDAMSWNDIYCRSKEQAVTTMRRVALGG